MINKRGKSANAGVWIVGIIGAILLIYFLITISSGSIEISTADKDFSKKSFGEINFGGSVGTISSLSFFDYIFGGVPKYLTQWVSNDVSALIVSLGVWALLLLAFSDIIFLFGTFGKGTSWLISVILTIIAANLNVITAVAVYALAITAFLGTYAIVASIFLIFVMFILFHFGSSQLRSWVLKRRWQDLKLKAAAGDEEAIRGYATLRKFGTASIED